MILAETSMWIDYLRGHRGPGRHDSEMERLLEAGRIVTHPFVIAEVALGSLHNRWKTLEEMDDLREVKVAHIEEVRHMIEAHGLYSRGIGLTDAHLIASCLITPGTQLWTRDAALKKVAGSMGILAP